MAQHRADPRAAAHRRLAGDDPAKRTPGQGRTVGRRRADTPGRVPQLAPRVAGGAAVLLAAAGVAFVAPDSGGAVIHGADFGASVSRSVTVSVAGATLTAADRAALADRTRAVSRDAQRATRADAADRRLQAATEKAAAQRRAALAGVARSAHQQADRIAADAWTLPVTPGSYHLTSRFGDCSALWSHCHTGLDFAGASGTPIHAVAAGTITEVGYAGAYGNRTIMTLPDGTDLWYCHQTAYTVVVGQKVAAGQVIGSIGSTGNTTGPHLHLEVRPGGTVPVDPFTALVALGLSP